MGMNYSLISLATAWNGYMEEGIEVYLFDFYGQIGKNLFINSTCFFISSFRYFRVEDMHLWPARI
jgi:hypothetical protein